MKTEPLDDAMLASVISHMNEDHSDACLAIAKSIGGYRNSHRATMQSMDANGADFLVVDEDNSEHTITVLFDKPVSRNSQIRGHLVALTKRARAILNE